MSQLTFDMALSVFVKWKCRVINKVSVSYRQRSVLNLILVWGYYRNIDPFLFHFACYNHEIILTLCFLIIDIVHEIHKVECTGCWKTNLISNKKVRLWGKWNDTKIVGIKELSWNVISPGQEDRLDYIAVLVSGVKGPWNSGNT